MSTTASFNHIETGSQPAHITKPWSKVDGGGISYGHEKVTRAVHDLRALSPADYNTDTSGFGTLKWASPPTDFTDDAAVRGPYYDDVVALLTADCAARQSTRDAHLKVAKVVIFDHTIRRRAPDSPRGPVQQVHVDQTPLAAAARVRRHLPRDEAEDLLKKRFQLINVWRPIAHKAEDHPLAVVDWRSTETRDFVPVDLMYPRRPDSVLDDDDRGKERLPDKQVDRFDTSAYEVRGETLGVLANEKHRFYYVKDMTPEEVLLLKCYDSWGEGEPAGKKGLAPRAPHTAFEDPATSPDAKPRESIEVRALVFYDEEA